MNFFLLRVKLLSISNAGSGQKPEEGPGYQRSKRRAAGTAGRPPLTHTRCGSPRTNKPAHARPHSAPCGPALTAQPLRSFMSSKPQRAPNALPRGPVPGCSPCPERAVARLPSPRWLSLTPQGHLLDPRHLRRVKAACRQRPGPRLETHVTGIIVPRPYWIRSVLLP